jgi:hypothetical protein
VKQPQNHVEWYTTGRGTFVVLTPSAGNVPKAEWDAYHREREAKLQRIAKSLGLTLSEKKT